jgi:hypothetical protein
MQRVVQAITRNPVEWYAITSYAGWTGAVWNMLRVDTSNFRDFSDDTMTVAILPPVLVVFGPVIAVAYALAKSAEILR